MLIIIMSTVEECEVSVSRSESVIFASIRRR